MPPPTYRISSAAELRAFDALCNTLSGFDARLHFEHVDGLLTALAATPHAPPLEDAAPLLLGDAWVRAYADPEAQAAALKTLQQRLAVLRDQLDPAALLDDPDGLRVEPLLADWDAIAEAAGENALPADAAAPRVGELWAQAFLEAVQALPEAWPLPAAEGAAEAFESAFGQLELLTLARDSEAWAERAKATFDDHVPSDDDLIAAACAAVQDLRLFWVDFAPKPETRRVEAAPGRNDPCPCGSGKKFKKCHGA